MPLLLPLLPLPLLLAVAVAVAVADAGRLAPRRLVLLVVVVLLAVVIFVVVLLTTTVLHNQQSVSQPAVLHQASVLQHQTATGDAAIYCPLPSLLLYYCVASSTSSIYLALATCNTGDRIDHAASKIVWSSARHASCNLHDFINPDHNDITMTPPLSALMLIAALVPILGRMQ